MPNPATTREQRLRKTKAQLIDEIDTLERRVSRETEGGTNEGELNDASHIDLLGRFMDLYPRLWRGCRANVEDHPPDQRRMAAVPVEGRAASRLRFILGRRHRPGRRDQRHIKRINGAALL